MSPLILKSLGFIVFFCIAVFIHFRIINKQDFDFTLRL